MKLDRRESFLVILSVVTGKSQLACKTLKKSSRPLWSCILSENFMKTRSYLWIQFHMHLQGGASCVCLQFGFFCGRNKKIYLPKDHHKTCDDIILTSWLACTIYIYTHILLVYVSQNAKVINMYYIMQAIKMYLTGF